MQKPTEYPKHLEFENDYLKHFAESLLPYAKAFFEGGILTDPSEGWENIFFHCLSEALTVDVLLDGLGDDNLDCQNLVAAAFLHDAYKRRELERVRREPDNIGIFYETDNESHEWLSSLGYPEAITRLHDGIGNNGARKIFHCEITDLGMRILQYVDDITMGDKVVSLEERLSKAENKPEFKKQNEWSRKFFDGLTLFEAKRVLNTKTEQELAERLGITNHNNLPAWIIQQRSQRSTNLFQHCPMPI